MQQHPQRTLTLLKQYKMGSTTRMTQETPQRGFKTWIGVLEFPAYLSDRCLALHLLLTKMGCIL
jgi:hypothetical protein